MRKNRHAPFKRINRLNQPPRIHMTPTGRIQLLAFVTHKISAKLTTPPANHQCRPLGPAQYAPATDLRTSTRLSRPPPPPPPAYHPTHPHAHPLPPTAAPPAASTRLTLFASPCIRSGRCPPLPFLPAALRDSLPPPSAPAPSSPDTSSGRPPRRHSRHRRTSEIRPSPPTHRRSLLSERLTLATHRDRASSRRRLGFALSPPPLRRHHSRSPPPSQRTPPLHRRRLRHRDGEMRFTL